MKGILLVLDGIADLPHQSLSQITPLQAAKTPNLDEIAKKSKLDYCHPVKRDFVPESNDAILALLGYDYLDTNRGPLETLGLGIKLTKGDLAFRCNFGTIDDLENKHVLDRRAGRTLTTREARILSKEINEKVKLPFKFKFYPSIQHRGVLVIRGGFSDNITPVERNLKTGKLNFSTPMDDADETNLSSNLVNQFVRHSHEVLNKHPINKERAKKGLFSANVILCRGAGSSPVKLKKLKGKWMALDYMPLEIGIAKAAGMDSYKFSYPLLKSIDVYSTLYKGLYKSIKNAIKMLKQHKKKYDYFYIHIKETDLPGHDNKPHDKVKMIEIIDKYLFSFLKKFVRNKTRLIITADHSTPSKLKMHSSDPVPVLTYPHPSEGKDQRFTEQDGLKGRKIISKKLLAEKLFSKIAK
jgi:2,3-bisphosphoglycerate-independent phosphoglycerate mutase